MAAPFDPLMAFADLERRFNGPIPEPLRLLAQHGSARSVLLLQAEGQAAFFKAMLRGQLALTRQRRRDGSFYPALLTDLDFYRRRWRHWRQRVGALRDSAPTLPPLHGGGGGLARAPVTKPQGRARAPAES